MKRPLVFLATLLTALAIPATVAGPAHAKGATDVVVSGPGIDDVELGFTPRTGDVDVGSLFEVSGIYGIYGDGAFVQAPDLTARELGPRYVLTWYEGSDVLCVSHVYPFADGGAWTHVPRGQESWEFRLAGGWSHGGSALEQAMVELGATPGSLTDGSPQTASSPVAPAGSVAETPPATPQTSRSAPIVLATLAAALGVLVVGGAWLARRRRTPEPLVTLTEPV